MVVLIQKQKIDRDQENILKALEKVKNSKDYNKLTKYIPIDLILEEYDPNSPLKLGKPEEFWDSLPFDPRNILIAGKKGQGKTATAFALIEYIYKQVKAKRNYYVIGLDNVRLPKWIDKVDFIDDCLNNSVVFINEGGRQLSAYSSGMKMKQLANILEVSRHKKLLLIVDLKNTALLNINVLRNIDTMIMKKPSLMQSLFERPQIKPLFDIARLEFMKIMSGMIQKGMSKEERNKKIKGYFVMLDEDYFGVEQTKLPSFWSDSISTGWAEK